VISYASTTLNIITFQISNFTHFSDVRATEHVSGVEIRAKRVKNQVSRIGAWSGRSRSGSVVVSRDYRTIHER